MKVLCVFGKHQYGDPIRGLGTEFAAFIPALERLGHRVVHFESWNRRGVHSLQDLNRGLIACVERERPDVMLTVQMHYELWRETLLAIKNRGDTATVTWMTDDSWKYEQVSRFIADAYHAVATTYDWILPRYYSDGLYNVIATQWAANPLVLRTPLPARDCKYAVTFVGANHGNRARTIDLLRKKGIDTVCFGHGWEQGSIQVDQIPDILRRSIISLNFANSRGENQIKARTFEVPGAGGFLLTETARGLEKYYDIGNEIVAFDDIDDAAMKIKYYLANPQLRDTIANAGFQRTVVDHTYDNRMSQLLSFTLKARDLYLRSSERGSIAALPSAPHDSINWAQRTTRNALLRLCTIVWGKDRGWRAARRLIFELSWRIAGSETFTAAGWPGRLFPESSPPSSEK